MRYGPWPRRGRLLRPGAVHSGVSPGVRAGAQGREHAPATGARAAHSPAVKDQSNHNPFRLAGVRGRPAPGVYASPRQTCQARVHLQEREQSAEPLMRGMEGDRNQWHGQNAAAVRSRCRADGGQERGLAAQPCAGQSSGAAVSAATLTGLRAAAQTGVYV